MRIYSFKRKTIPKVAALATALTAAFVVATVSPLPAQAFPSYATACTGCHAAGGSVAATPSSATPAPGAAFTVAIAFTGGSGNAGYWISGNGVSLTGGPAAGSTFSVAMTAPAAAGSYTYTVWMRQTATASKTFTITVGPVATTPPPTTIPPTTVPPTTVPPTTVPPTTVPPTTIPPTTVPPTTVPPTTVPPTTIPPTTIPPTTVPPTTVPPTTGGLGANSALGKSHLSMYNGFGSKCATCHNGLNQPKAPRISISGIDMKPGRSCSQCHSGTVAIGKKVPLFVSLMNDPTKATYGRCSDCHQIGGK